MREEDLVEIFKICGFYNSKRSALLATVFKDWVAASFDLGTVEVTTFKKRTLIKIGCGESPKRPASQLAEGLTPPRFRMRSTTVGKSSMDSLMLLFKKPPPTEATATTTATTTTATTSTTTTPTPTTAAAAASPLRVTDSPMKLSQKFNISSPDKFNLTMELVCDFDTPQRAPLLRELVKGSSLSIEALNNKDKTFIRVPQCSNEASAMSQNVKHKFAQEIAKTLGAGAETVIDGLHQGASWLCRIMAKLYKDEYAHSAARAGVSCISRMTPKATASMFTAAKLTKTKSRLISAHLAAWFKQPITAKETDVVALAGKQHVKRTYAKYGKNDIYGRRDCRAPSCY
jgi:hypothetical protein